MITGASKSWMPPDVWRNRYFSIVFGAAFTSSVLKFLPNQILLATLLMNVAV